jgi:hypothetical protein
MWRSGERRSKQRRKEEVDRESKAKKLEELGRDKL